MPSRMADFVVRRHLPFPSTLWLEAWSAVAILAWPVWALAHWEAFTEVDSYQPAFHYLPPAAWVALCMTVGSAQMAACVVKLYRLMRATFAFLASTVWCALAILVYSADPNPSGIALYLVWGAANAVVVAMLIQRRFVAFP